ATLFATWEALRDRVLLDKGHFHSCIDSNTPCPEVSTLKKIADEAYEYQGKALFGHLNRSINLLIKAAPGNWTAPLEAITMSGAIASLIPSLSMRRFAWLGSLRTTSGSSSCTIKKTMRTIWLSRSIRIKSGSFSTT